MDAGTSSTMARCSWSLLRCPRHQVVQLLIADMLRSLCGGARRLCRHVTNRHRVFGLRRPAAGCRLLQRRSTPPRRSRPRNPAPAGPLCRGDLSVDAGDRPRPQNADVRAIRCARSTGLSTRECAVSRSTASSGVPTPCSETWPARASSSHPPSPAWPSLSPASFRRNSSSPTRCLILRRSAR